MTKTNVQPIPSNSQHHDTPNNKTHVIKFRVTENEKLELESMISDFIFHGHLRGTCRGNAPPSAVADRAAA